LSLLLWAVRPVFSEFVKIIVVKYHSNSNSFKTCGIPQLFRLIWAKTKLVFVQISLKSRGIPHVLKEFEFEWFKIALD